MPDQLTDRSPLDAAAARDHADFLALQSGEGEALNRLIARWERPLFAFAWRYVRSTADARDLVADVFVRLYQHRERLAADTRLAAWLFTTLTNLCHNHHRWRRRHPTVSLDAGGPPETSEAGGQIGESLFSDSPSPGMAAEHGEILAALAAAIDRLPPDWKATLLLHHYEQMSYRDIAAITGCSERGVETRLYRARRRLHKELTTFLPDGSSAI